MRVRRTLGRALGRREQHRRALIHGHRAGRPALRVGDRWIRRAARVLGGRLCVMRARTRWRRQWSQHRAREGRRSGQQMRYPVHRPPFLRLALLRGLWVDQPWGWTMRGLWLGCQASFTWVRAYALAYPRALRGVCGGVGETRERETRERALREWARYSCCGPRNPVRVQHRRG